MIDANKYQKGLKVYFSGLAVLLFLWVVPRTAWSQSGIERSVEWRSLLNHLAGRWELSGEMSGRDLHQFCEAEWILDLQFLHMSCEATAPDTSGYRARYIIGFDSTSNRYLFHLFDTYGAAYSKTLGYGVPGKNQIAFSFDYPGQQFRNTFIWHPEEQSWEMILQQKNEESDWELFAQKNLKKLQ